MIDAWVVWAVATVAVLIVGWLCFRLSRVHMHCSILNQTISDMLQQPRAAEAIAAATMDRLVQEGYVKKRG